MRPALTGRRFATERPTGADVGGLLAVFDAAADPAAAARRHLERAETMVNETGYHRRDAEVEELKRRMA